MNIDIYEVGGEQCVFLPVLQIDIPQHYILGEFNIQIPDADAGVQLFGKIFLRAATYNILNIRCLDKKDHDDQDDDDGSYDL